MSHERDGGFFLPKVGTSQAMAEVSMNSRLIPSTSQGRGETPANPGSTARLGASTGSPARRMSEKSLEQPRERGRAAQAQRSKGRGLTGDYSPVSKPLLFSEETGESTVIFFNENRIPFASFPLQLSPSLQMK